LSQGFQIDPTNKRTNFFTHPPATYTYVSFSCTRGGGIGTVFWNPINTAIVFFEIHKGNKFQNGNKKVSDAFNLYFDSFGGYEMNILLIFFKRGETP